MRFHKAESAFFVFIFVILAAGLVTFHAFGQLQDIASDLDAASRVDKIVYLNKLLFVTGALLATALFFGTFFIYPLIRGQVREEGKLRAMTVSLSARSQTLEQAALTDGLTGMQNRRYFDDALREYLHEFRRIDRPVGLMILDLDHFKMVNDTLGHPVGDALLKEVAARLKQVAREGDTVARLGGDEFVIIQTAVDQPVEATALAQRVIDGLSAPYVVDGHGVMISASIGISIAPDDGIDADQLLKTGDMALYRAKAEGRGTYRFFEPEMD
ncbi:MAG: GGDEF domain-containing protein, partial [Mesorhizobium sp.]